MKRGFEIIEQNYNKKWGEIDIIARKGQKLHFIEVKSVSRDSLKYVSPETDSYRPEDNLHPWKLERLSRVIQTYLLGYKGNRSVSCQPGNSTGETDAYRPEDNLHPWKLKRVSRVIQTYLLGYDQVSHLSARSQAKEDETDWQFDVIVVYLDIKNLQAKVNYMEDIII